MKNFQLIVFCTLLALYFTLGLNVKPVGANRATTYLADKSCLLAAKRIEKRNGIPNDLLSSIALSETGRWNPNTKEMFAWPWTVTSSGKGHYYPNKTAAVRAVKKLQLRGVQNIDVGCMQINLLYHPNAFRSLDEAFNAHTNVEYARKFLVGLYKSTGDWIQAAANYHSTNPQKNLNYQTKLLRIWNKLSKTPIGERAVNPHRYVKRGTHQARLDQVALINTRFRARLEAERNNRKDSAESFQLKRWRNLRSSPNLLSHTASLQKATIAKSKKMELKRNELSFSKKRLRQLAKWRKDRNYFKRKKK
ncbi:MAG: transglycosylase SLT domain-containing protein [Pseudomonadota bacterium]|nr:transglycosylase SLT domain-containing protein [Pseudomonadota bacterium]